MNEEIKSLLDSLFCKSLWATQNNNILFFPHPNNVRHHCLICSIDPGTEG